MVLPAAIKRVLSLCTPVPTAALHGPRTAAAREAVPVCDGCKRPSANLMVNEFGVTCAACCMHALLGGDDAPCVRCGGPCVEGQMNAQHVCFACLCVEACGGEREAMAELQRVMALTKGETPPGTRVTLRAACEDIEAHVRDTAAVLAAAPVPPLGAPAVVRSFDAATRMYTVALSDGSGALLQRPTDGVRMEGQKIDVPARGGALPPL